MTKEPTPQELDELHKRYFYLVAEMAAIERTLAKYDPQYCPKCGAALPPGKYEVKEPGKVQNA